MSSRPAPVPADRPKATLFCPDCGHESVVDGDWVVRDEGSRRRYVCPACGATVERRAAAAAPA